MNNSYKTSLTKLVLHCHYLSIEIAAGVLIQAYTIQNFLRYNYPYGYMPLITLVSLWIYWTDKFLDIKSIVNKEALPERHQWFFKQRKALLILWLILTLSILIALILLPRIAWIWALPGAFATVAYLLINYLLKNNFWIGLMKEICVAFIYSYALWYLPFIQTQKHDAVVYAIATFFLAYQNLLMLAFLDKDTDRLTQTHSTVQGLGMPTSKYLITFVSIAGISILGWAWQFDYMMAVCMLLVYLWQILFFYLCQKNPKTYRTYWDYGFFLIGLYNVLR